MNVYVDTSGLYAGIVSDDPEHARAAEAWQELRRLGAGLVTTSYVLVETAALLQSRVGVGALQTLSDRFVPLLDVAWVDAELHAEAMAALLAAGLRGVSLVDWVGFSLMRRRAIDTAFALDDDFSAQGFAVIPEP